MNSSCLSRCGGFLHRQHFSCCLQTNCAAAPQITPAAAAESVFLFIFSYLSLSVFVCSRGGAGVRGDGGASGVLGQPRTARLGLRREARVDLQRRPGRRADPGRPAGGLTLPPPLGGLEVRSRWKEEKSETLRVTVTKTQSCWTRTKRTALRTESEIQMERNKKKLYPTGGTPHKTSRTL